MTQQKGREHANPPEHMPDAERVAAELARAEPMGDLFGKVGIFAKLFANTLAQMMAVKSWEKNWDGLATLIYTEYPEFILNILSKST